MNPSDEIKSKLDIVEVIREYIQLKPAGTNFQAVCPFHNEKSPSFVVSPEKQIWHCFGCNKGGDIFTFIMEKEGMTFVEALRLLAPKAGVVLQNSGFNGQNNSLKTRALDVLEAAARFYERLLAESSEAEDARNYLEKRGLTRAVIEEWQIGYSSLSWDDLLVFLKAQGFNEREIETAGLVSKGQGGNRYYNRFRGRIMFPICDGAGQIVAFTARQVPGHEDKMGKYINSPSGICYDKSKVLFALDKAKQAIREAGFAVIVEGQMDAITSHQFGFVNTVASSGTALTEEQLAQLNRFTDTIILALDADSAGQAAAERAGQIMGEADRRFVEREDRFGRLKSFIDPQKKYKHNVKVALVPGGKDPDEAIRQSVEKWQQALAEATSLAEFYFQRSLNGLDLSKLEDRKKVASRFLPLVARFDDLDKDYWLRRLAGAIDTDSKYLYEALNKAKVGVPARRPTESSVTEIAKPLNREELLSQNILALLLRFSAYIKYILDYVSPDQLVGGQYQALYKVLIVYYNEEQNRVAVALRNFVLDYNNFKLWLSARNLTEEAKTLDKLVILGERDYFTYSDVQADTDLKAMTADLRKNSLNVKRRQLSRLIAVEEANSNKQPEKINSLYKELAGLNEELRRLL
ncbi:DNA primase [Candidatus Falkowbacteria bacterium CG10_big_fil_rev_8_21_14_0_10_37_14]|uniref:DNA primase n=1 Tax=Candidatus Falkowbacteria bacterium CG10_big_fil_rev_8_21_14_0_10_37_14 TaxID=1974561 RepID=A0A2M6WTK8_9BACT|nr:DNA primase [Candidatus Falkowbacteria bacterium]PIT96122.1 MAG: DNA primase [Candidatus Falkowbacteria bacterium CG10_big_fil_rev_8_21_14_0_10_37_14]